MSEKIIIIDYQLGNLFSVKQAFEYLGYDAVISSDPEMLLNARFAVLPGVGAFKDAMDNMDELGLSTAIRSYASNGGALLGVCLGLQLLLTSSEEFGDSNGLNIIPGKVKKFPKIYFEGKTLKVPQIQWNQIHEPNKDCWSTTPLKGCKDGDYMYFVHSFYAEPENRQDVVALTKYGDLEYCSSVSRGSVFATQFHPEKSGIYGLGIYKSWLEQNGIK